MLEYRLLKNHAGILLCGDYLSLRDFHDAIHAANERSVLVKDKEGAFLGLAYDVRKAFEQQREILEPPDHYLEIGPRFGVQILWPVLLVQSRIFRESLAFFDSSKIQQALAFNLESVIEAALQEDFGVDSLALVDLWQRIDPKHPWPEEKLHSRGAQFCVWRKAERKKKLRGLLASFDPMYPFYYEHWAKAGDRDLVSPEALDALHGAEWVDPHW